MSESKGLRFDIFERIRLSEETESLDRLDQIELLPHIEVISQGEQAVLKGHLLLSGQFSREGTMQVNTLEHSIPVEITLPMNRIPNLDEINVEIENFDIDLVAPNMLNVTGVLSLGGIELLKTQDAWQESKAREETEDGEALFVHHAASSFDQEKLDAEDADQQSSIWRAEDTAVNKTVQTHAAHSRRNEASSSGTMDSTNDRRSEAKEKPAKKKHVQEAKELEAVESLLPNQENIAANEHSSNEENIEWIENEQLVENVEFKENEASEDISFEHSTIERAEEDVETPIVEVVAEAESTEATDALEASDIARLPDTADKELKIAFTGRQESADAQGANLNTLLAASDSSTALKSNEESAEAAESREEETIPSDAAEWKTIFLSKEADEQQFSSLRMCIVQKEETIETIAQRYSLNPREIMLYNRINDQNVKEGQILYIP